MVDPDKLSPWVLHQLADQTNDVVLSVVSGLEIALKYRMGKLALDRRPSALVSDGIGRLDLTVLPVSMAHGIYAGGLPMHHKDPFDRLLIAQAEIEELILVSPDTALQAYNVKMLW